MPDDKARVRAPEFPEGMAWLNTAEPIRLASLRGKVVVLDFWTFCCINCMHILPDLKKLERKYPNELVVIGVHSAKFDQEKVTENIRQAILRYEIEHPVVNDSEMVIWSLYGVHSWPTVFLIDPQGRAVGYTSGEGIYDPFNKAIEGLIAEFAEKGLLNRNPMRFLLERDKMKDQTLSFPGKILADPEKGQLFISDSNHNRILISTLEGQVLEIIGNGSIGLKDGGYAESEFNHPQGMALRGDQLYVADTENHALRCVNLTERKVSTLVGNGKQAVWFNEPEKGGEVLLNSPWDIAIHADTLYIAMAGPHQIWKYNLADKAALPYAGNGREARVDGPLRNASLAQPSGIAQDGSKLYFADSEISSIRSADLNPKGNVETIVGLDLFEFGDRDGVGPEVRLQHPLGICWHAGLLYVADTYNNKIKVIDPLKKSSTTLLGDGVEGDRDGASPRFDEPSGLAICGEKLYIADTNNHAIRVADLKTREVSTLKLTLPSK